MKLGFVGAGNMAKAIISGICLQNNPCDIGVFDIYEQKAFEIKKEYPVEVFLSIEQLTRNSDIIFLCVKPNVAKQALKDIFSFFTKEQSLVSIVAGLSTMSIENELFPKAKILRLMPNAPLQVSCGVTAFVKEHTLSKEVYSSVYEIFSKIGKCVEVEEKHIDAVTALSGSGPAFAAMFIDALKQGGILCGLTQEQAVMLAAQTVLGTAKLILENNMHPEQLCDIVCSPGGTTIEGVKVLQSNSFKGSVMNAVEAAYKKAQVLK